MANFEEKLINLVSEQEYLYNTKSRSYKNIIKRDFAWAKIAEELGRPVDDCTQRWKSLRDRYVRETKKMEQPSGSSAAEYEVWELFDSLQFLNEALRPRKQVGNYDISNESLCDIPEFSNTQENCINLTNCSTPEPIQKQPAKRSRPGDGISDFFGDLSKTLSERFKAQDADENDLFMKALALKMKSLPQHAKIRLQEKFLSEVNSELLYNYIVI